MRKLLVIEALCICIVLAVACLGISLQPLLWPLFPEEPLPPGWIDASLYAPDEEFALERGMVEYLGFGYRGDLLGVIYVGFNFTACDEPGRMAFRLNKLKYVTSVHVEEPSHKLFIMIPCCAYYHLLVPDELNIVGFHSPREDGFEGKFRFYIRTARPVAPAVAEEAGGDWRYLARLIGIPGLSIGCFDPFSRNPVLEPLSYSLYDGPGRHSYVVYDVVGFPFPYLHVGYLHVGGGSEP